MRGIERGERRQVCRIIGFDNKCPYEGVIVSTALYGAEAWGMRSAERRK